MNHYIFLECTQDYGYCFSAANTKTEFLARGLYEKGCNVTIHNGIYGSKIVKETTYLEKKGIGKVITYKMYGHKLISWIFNLPILYKYLKKSRNKNNKNIMLLELPDYHIFLLYVILGKLLDYKILIISHEWGPIVKSVKLHKKPSMWLFAKTFGYMADGILPISEYIIHKIKHFNKPYLKIPILADYNVFPNPYTNNKDNSNYLLYCVYSLYTKQIFMIINSYRYYLANNNTFKLYLILSGPNEAQNTIKNYIEKEKLENNIKIRQSIPYDELFELYCNAKALIIPLDPDEEQDKARFSQKIAEYLSSGTPIISNNVGEIKYYFKNMENIILCQYETKSFAEAFKWISKNKEKSKEIGINGFYLGQQEFNYKYYGKRIIEFSNNLF